MPSQKLRILALLQSAGEEGISSLWFIQNYLPRAAARIRELREEGWDIRSERITGLQYCRYTLQGGDANALRKSGDLKTGRIVAEPRVEDGSGLSESLFDQEVTWHLSNPDAA